jgi:O-antigen ligase
MNKLAFYLLNISAVLYVYRFDILGINVTAARVCIFGMVIAALFQIHAWSYAQWRVAATAGLLVLLKFSDLTRGYDTDVARGASSHMLLLMLFVCLYGVLRNSERILSFIDSYVVTSMLAFGIAVYQEVTGYLPFEILAKGMMSDTLAGQEYRVSGQELPGGGSLTRWASSFYDPNFYGMYIVSVLLFCTVLLSVNQTRRKRWLIGIILVANSLALVLTLSRSAFLGLIVSMFVGVCWLKKSRIYIVGLGVTVLLCIFAAHYFTDAEWFRMAGQRMTLGDEALGSDPGDVFGRSYYFEEGLQAFLSSPVFGVGVAQLLSSGLPFANAHNTYLTFLARYGILGFGCFVVFFLHPVGVALTGLKSRGDIFRFLVIAFVSSTLIVYLGYDYFELLETQYICFAVVYAVCDQMLVGDVPFAQGKNFVARGEASGGVTGGATGPPRVSPAL